MLFAHYDTRKTQTGLTGIIGQEGNCAYDQVELVRIYDPDPIRFNSKDSRMYLTANEILLDHGITLEIDVWDHADEQYFGGILPYGDAFPIRHWNEGSGEWRRVIFTPDVGLRSNLMKC